MLQELHADKISTKAAAVILSRLLLEGDVLDQTRETIPKDKIHTDLGIVISKTQNELHRNIFLDNSPCAACYDKPIGYYDLFGPARKG